MASKHGRFTHRCLACGRGRYLPGPSRCCQAPLLEIKTGRERLSCEHETVSITGVQCWPYMCVRCGALSRRQTQGV